MIPLSFRGPPYLQYCGHNEFVMRSIQYITRIFRCSSIKPKIFESVNLGLVWSNPGVSIRVTFRPLSSKEFDAWTRVVSEAISLPTLNSEPLAKLINYG